MKTAKYILLSIVVLLTLAAMRWPPGGPIDLGLHMGLGSGNAVPPEALKINTTDYLKINTTDYLLIQ